MLTLTRRIGETIAIGPDIEVTVVGVSGGRVRLGIRAPRRLPIHRLELVERARDENQRAVARAVAERVDAGEEIRIPGGLYGLGGHDRFLLCDLGEGNPIRALVSCVDPEVQLLVVDATVAWPGYPEEAARAALGVDEPVAIALVVTVPADGGVPRVNLAAPIVVGLESREGAQVLLEQRGLEMSAPLTSAPREEAACPPR